MTNHRTIQPHARKVIVGVDTHKHVHVAVAIDTWGIRLGDRSCAADSDGYQQLITWAERHGRVAAFSIEGTGSYGAGLARAVRMAVENPQWGYTRIRGALSNLGHEIARTTVKRILHDHGIDPAPERSRRMPWKTFLQAHGEGLTACDLFTVEGLTLAGLPRDLVCFVIALPSRRVTIAGIPPPPYGTWMEQMARNLTDPVDGCLRRARSLMHDRDPLDTRGFGEILEGGVSS